MLIAENIACQRGKSIIFNNLGFCLQPEALLLLKGRNGAGKSSLLDILSGNLAPASGQVLWNDAPIKGNKAFRHDTMVVGHDNTIVKRKTVTQHLAATAKRYDTEMLIPAALKFYDLEKVKDVRAGELSNGWKRRMALAQLIVAPCKLWLLDEPTDFLDEDAVQLTVGLIETRIRQGGIVIAASHSLKSGLDAHVLDMEDFKT